MYGGMKQQAVDPMNEGEALGQSTFVRLALMALRMGVHKRDLHLYINAPTNVAFEVAAHLHAKRCQPGVNGAVNPGRAADMSPNGGGLSEAVRAAAGPGQGHRTIGEILDLKRVHPVLQGM